MADGAGAWQPAREAAAGAYELQDAVLSSYVKGECTSPSDLPLLHAAAPDDRDGFRALSTPRRCAADCLRFSESVQRTGD